MIEALFSLPKLRVLHIQQRYNEEKRQTNLLHFQHVENLVSTNISNMKLQGVAVTSSALEVLSFKYAKTMSSLCLIGSLMHTQDIDVYFRALSYSLFIIDHLEGSRLRNMTDGSKIHSSR
ncbi:unnamed protein product [Toxocara canis]|uniref:WASH-7_N domain-containing protein n=1 Tax=Toxocara canis TaxID=6265 RepID=A0A183U8J8_TOXCA|nr:unnamed protein product [Toxocara canis]